MQNVGEAGECVNEVHQAVTADSTLLSPSGCWKGSTTWAPEAPQSTQNQHKVLCFCYVALPYER